MSIKLISGLLKPMTRLLSSNKVNIRFASTVPTTQERLMEFFDHKDNWAKNIIRVGRSWRKDELRLKSNQDLHKLWYVLLKERNMLLTMEEEYKNRVDLFPNPERLDKVKESMVNLEDVIRERNKAYHLLETGETGERPGSLESNALGVHYFYKTSEHILPKTHNSHWFKTRQLWFNRKECARFLLFMREKRYIAKKKERTIERNQAMMLLKRFPDIDLDALKSEYPSVNIEKIKWWRKAQGHYVPE